MKYRFLIIAFIIVSFCHAQVKINREATFIVDSITVTQEVFKKLNPNTIAAVSVYKDSTAIKLLGEQGKNGAIYVETKSFAKKRFRKYLSNKSAEYKKLFPNVDSDATAVYVLNGKVKTDNFEGDLALIDDTTFKSIKIIDRKKLSKDYKIVDKEYGIIIVTTPTEGK